jgi:hypothetical protein
MQWPEYILSSVTPIFDKTSEGYFYNDLSNAFLNILNTANDAKTINSLAIPLLATGNYGAPVNRCAIALVDAIINFSNKKVSSECHIREIHLVNIEDSTTKAMIDCLESSMVESRGLIRRLSDDSTNNFDSKINVNLMDNISDVGDPARSRTGRCPSSRTVVKQLVGPTGAPSTTPVHSTPPRP